MAQNAGIPVFTPDDINASPAVEQIKALQPDLILSAYYRHLISEQILGTARLGAFNLHGSLLPKYRGRAPVNWAILQGESRIGMTLHRMVRRPDAGGIVDQEAVEIGVRDTAEEAFRKVLPCSRRILERQIEALLAGTATETPQDDSQATYFGARGPADGRIDWTKSSRAIFNLIRAVTDPYPGAFTEIDGAQLIVWWAEMDSHAVRKHAAANAHAASSRPLSGEILSVSPLVVATADGALELTRTEWRGNVECEFHVGQRL